jgi:hypothetical protein
VAHPHGPHLVITLAELSALQKEDLMMHDLRAVICSKLIIQIRLAAPDASYVLRGTAILKTEFLPPARRNDRRKLTA